ncbi:muramidase [Paracidovorax cattleyae]|nr:glycoside hydrolase family 104 protein [Paracidovorax cattleyae]AVS76410.1 muramidase [Paracidovorax cattleyae]
MIAWAEGTTGDDGYRTLFGGGKFDSFADHPRIYVPFRNTSSSAAGRYQILARTWDGLRAKLGLPDFGPDSQDAAALELIRERGALNDVDAGRVSAAIAKVAKVWASLPGAGYSQPERSLMALMGVYQQAGGNLA